MVIHDALARLEELFTPGYTPNPLTAHRRDGDSIAAGAFSHREDDFTYGLATLVLNIDLIVSSDPSQEQGWSYALRMGAMVDSMREVISKADGPWREIDVTGSQLQEPNMTVSLEVLIDAA